MDFDSGTHDVLISTNFRLISRCGSKIFIHLCDNAKTNNASV